jgi:hypothetical protein
MDTHPEERTSATPNSFTSQQMRQQGEHDMHAVIRETSYAPERRLEEMSEFTEFQKAHAARQGYRGTIVTRIGDGRYVTITLWASAADMDAAREALGPVVQRLLNPLMTAPTQLYGTGQVVATDLPRALNG